MNKRAGRITLYLIVGIIIPLLIVIIYKEPIYFLWTLAIFIGGLIVEVVYKIQGKE